MADQDVRQVGQDTQGGASIAAWPIVAPQPAAPVSDAPGDSADTHVAYAGDAPADIGGYSWQPGQARALPEDAAGPLIASGRFRRVLDIEFYERAPRAGG